MEKRLNYEDANFLGQDTTHSGLAFARGDFYHWGSISNADANTLIKEFSNFESMVDKETHGGKPITLHLIDSPGGSAEAAVAIHDALRAMAYRLDLPIHVIVYGGAASAAAQIVLQAGDKRLAHKNSLFLLHEVRRFVTFEDETTSDLKDVQDGMNRMTKIVYEILGDRCGYTEEELTEYINRRDIWMTSKEALEWNLIDEVVQM